MEIKAEVRLILSSIKIKPTPAEIDRINSLIPLINDWEYLIKTITDRGIGPLLFNKLPQLSNSSLIPEAIKIKLQQVYYKTISRSMVLYDHFRKIAEAFTSLDIPVIALKGIYLSEWLYQDIGLRQFSDIDLLVKEEDGGKCLAVLQEMGYKPCDSSVTKFIGSKTEIIHYTPMVFNAVSVEIHIKLHRKTESYDLNVNELWKNAIPVTVNKIPVFALNTNDLLIHLCIHLDKHFRGSNVQFTCFNDITNILEKFATKIDWNEFTEACRLYKCEEVVFKYLILTNKYINATVPNELILKYNFLLTEKDELLFCKYLSGFIGDFSAVPIHFANLKQIDAFSDQLRYVRDLLFPPKSFMILKYKIRKNTFVPFYYPYRYFIGLKGIASHILNSIRKKRRK